MIPHKYFESVAKDVLEEIKEKKEIDEELEIKIKKHIEDYAASSKKEETKEEKEN